MNEQTIEAEIVSSNQQRQIDVLEAQLQEAEDIITDLRSELRWVRDELEKAKEQETISSHSGVVVVVASLNSPNQDMSESLLNQSSLHHDEKSVEISKGFDNACESELDAKIRNKNLELSRNGCTQSIHAFEAKSSSFANDKNSEENLSSENTRCLVLALRAKNAEVITAKPLNALGIKKSCKLRGRKKRKWSKGKAKPVRYQSQLIKPCQSQSDLPCSKTFMENSDGMETNLLEENEEVDAFNACKGLEEHLQHKNPTDHMVEACQESNLVSDNVEDGAKTKPLPHLNTVVNENATNGSTDKDLKSREEALSVKCEGEKDSVVQSTKMSSELANPCSDSKGTAVVSNQITESPRTEGNRLVKYTFQRKRKRDL